jgi:maleylpyruvate isomerase
VRIALHHKGLKFEYAPVHLVKDGGQQNTKEYGSINPARTVPLLELAEGGRVVRIAESMAIMEFLEERHPTPPLLPKDPFLRARARQLAEMVNAGIQPRQNLAVLQYIKREFQKDDKAFARHWIERGLGAMEALAAATAGRFLVGDEVSLADACLIPQLYHARRFEADVTPYVTLLRVEAACAVLPAFVAAHADAQRDAEK